MALEPRRNAAGLRAYLISVNSTSVRISARRQWRAKKNTVSIPLRHELHQIQLPAMPWVATTPETNSGVSAAKVVATIEVPASHQETLRPEIKNSSVFPLACRR